MLVDLHAHLLPGMDDGPATEAEAIKLGIKAMDEGVEYLVLTPKYGYSKKQRNRAEEVKQALTSLRQSFIEAELPLRIYAAHEIPVTKDLMDRFEDGELLSLDGKGKYYLVEFPDNKIPNYVYEVIDDLLDKGVTPVIANPENNRVFAKDVNELYDFIEAGCLAQISASAYVGEYGPEVQDLCYQMLENNLVHIVASDVHQVADSFNMRKAFKRIEEVYGQDTVHYLQENARHIFNGEAIERRMPVED
ncbi:hypothetical protein NHG29_03550 [Aerococcaceae bacterium NML160702]|nr:hypothetical protein [Aerococcaceae bacterium NML160702]